MEQRKVIYMNPEQAKELDPSLIDSVMLTTGSIIKVFDQGEAEEFQEENISSNQPICENCHLPIDITNNTENVFRGGKQGEEEVAVEAEQTEETKEVLRGPNGMPLLGEILSGGEYNNYNTEVPPTEQIPVQEPSIPINQPVPPIEKPIVQPPVQVPSQPVPQPPVQPMPQPPVQTPVQPMPQPQVQPPVQRPVQPPVQKPMYPYPQRPMYPPNQTPMQRPFMPRPKGPLNPSVRPFIPPKPKIIPAKPMARPPNVIPAKVAPKPAQPPKVIMPIKKKDNVFIHPGFKNNVFRNRRMVEETEEEVLCPDCAHELLCPDCANKELLSSNNELKEVVCPDCAKKGEICPECLKKEEDEKKKEEDDKKKEEDDKKKEEDDKKKEEERKRKEEERKNRMKANENKYKVDVNKYKKKENERSYRLKEAPKVRKEEIKKGKDGDVDFDNYKYHEINEKTAKNKKSQVVVKKEGVIIASHDE